MEEATGLLAIFSENGIPGIIEDNSAAMPDFFIGQNIEPQVAVKIHPDHFASAKELLDQAAQAEINEVSPDHYLFSFSDDELKDLLAEADKWSEFDYHLAKKILAGRGISISADEEKQLREQRLQTLHKTEEMKYGWIIFGYIAAALGGFAGIMVGLTLWTGKKTLPDGTSVYNHPEEQRMHGKIITIGGIIIFVVCVFLKVKFQVLSRAE